MKKLFFSSLICLVITPLLTSAQETGTTSPREINYQICKKAALTKKERTMEPVLKAYVASSKSINDQTVHDYDAIKWFTETTYASESKKIEERRTEAMSIVNNKVSRVRLVAQATWKAEDALCEFTYASTKDTPVKKETKK